MEDRQQKLIYIRLIGFLLLHWPSDEAVLAVANRIESNGEHEVENMGQIYYVYLLRLCELAHLPP